MSHLKNEAKHLNTFANLFESGNVKQRREREDHHGIIIGGHRGGALKLQPENTMRAFEHAIEIGLQVIELDVSKPILSIYSTNLLFIDLVHKRRQASHRPWRRQRRATQNHKRRGNVD